MIKIGLQKIHLAKITAAVILLAGQTSSLCAQTKYDRFKNGPEKLELESYEQGHFVKTAEDDKKFIITQTSSRGDKSKTIMSTNMTPQELLAYAPDLAKQMTPEVNDEDKPLA